MNFLNEVLGIDKPFERITIAGGQTEGYIVPPEPSANSFQGRRRGPGGSEYAHSIRQREEERERQQMLLHEAALSARDPMTNVDDLTSLGTIANVGELEREELTQVYETYDFEKQKPNAFSKLAVFDHEESILNMICTYRVCVIKGKTGCGKTTQIPQMILDAHFKAKRHCNIIVTQPRRIAAITVANRVSEERNWPLGSIVGYQVGLERKVNSDTRLTYCTTGCLLQKLILAKHMNEYTHIILDEVHERDQDMDFLMLVVRKFQRTVSPQVKVILMSATINTSAFTQYFSTANGDEAPVIEVSSKTNYPVSIYYLDSFEQRLGNFPEVAESNPKIDEKSYEYVEKIIQACDYIDKEEAKLYNNRTGSILVFLPGLHEIEELYELLEVIQREKGEKKWWICPLHSTVTADEQLRAFKAPPHQLRKIILSTNIAESSVTVPDIKYVIDFCLTKVMYADPDTNLSSLHMCWASKNQCEQRAGRVGRVMPGRVYRLVPKSFYDYCMEEEGKPEILRCPLESVVLKCKLLEMGEPIEILALAMDPPDLNRLEQTILLLKETGALLMTVNGEYSSLDGDLTTLGRIMAALPLDVKISKLIYLGHIFSVLEDTIIMGCAMTVKSMFSKPFKQDLQAYISKLTWADSTCSDSIACLNAYRLWRHSKTQGSFDRSAGTGAKGWGKRFFIQLNAMTEIARLQDEVTQRLKTFKIEKITSRNRVNWDNFTKPLIMKIVIAGAFYPHYFVRSQSGGQVNESDAVKLLGGRDPFSTVYLTNFPPNQPGILYANSIREHFKNCGVESSNVKISFDQSSKVYIEFKDSNTGSQIQNNDGRNFTYAIPGKVSMAVYRALKMRHYTSSSVTILVLPPEEAKRQMKKIEEAKKKEKQIDKTSILPSVLISFIEIRVTHVNDAGNFYVQYSDQEHHSKLIQMHECLNRSGLLHKLSGLPVKNKIYAVQFKDPDGTNEFYRALVLDVENKVAKVLFVDYGNVENVAMSSICTFEAVHRIPTAYGMEEINLETEPYLAFKCTLALIQPSLIKNHRALWSRDANNEFKKYCCNRNLMAKVYSVVDNVAALEVYISGNETHTRTKRYDEDARALVTINERLVQLKLAEWNEESYLSKVDHELRETQQNCESVYGSAVESRSTSSDWVNSDVLAFLKKQCRKPVRLKGPNSPLEMTVYSCVQSNLKKQVFIEQDSVNSILLDTHPHDPHERMLVAASVGQSAGGERLTLRYTTILPNIHGLSALICLLFCPYAEFRVNEAGTRFTGALCGLGWDPEVEEPYFPENDLEVTFDTSFNLDDIQVINKLRYRMNIFMCNSDTHDPMDFSLHETIDHQKKVEDLIIQLLAILAEQKTERMESCHESYVWGQVDDSKLLHPGAEEPWFTYRLHYGVNLEDEPATFEPNERLKKNILELKEIASGRAPIKGAMCNLCQVSLDNVRSLKLHLQSTQHNDLAKRYNLVQLNH